MVFSYARVSDERKRKVATRLGEAFDLCLSFDAEIDSITPWYSSSSIISY